MTFINSVKVSVRKLVKTFFKIGLVSILSIPILLIFSLVAPKANAYDETTFTSVSLGQTPLQLIELARSVQSSSFNSFDTGSYLVYVLDPQLGDLRQCYVYFIPENVLNISFHDYANNSAWLESDLRFSYINFGYSILSDNSVSISFSGFQENRTIDIEKNKLSSNYGNLWTNRCTITISDTTINPSPIQTIIDGYSVTPRGWTFSFDVYPLPTSQHIAWYYQTRRYIVRISATYEGQPITLDVPNYLSWTPTTKINPVVEPFNKTENGQLIPVFQITTTGAEKSVMSYYQNVMYYRFDTNDDNISFITMSQPDIDYTDDNSSHWVDTSTVEMSLSLYNLLKAFREAYPNNTFSDNWLYQDFSLSFIGYDDNKTYYTQVLSYSVVSDKIDAPPDVDTNQNNWFDNRQTIIDNINNNATYDFLSNPPARWSSPLSLNSLDSIPSIDSPDYSFPDISSLDSSATGFFSWLVNLVVSSPIGLLILIGLGFLVVKAVVNQ